MRFIIKSGNLVAEVPSAGYRVAGGCESPPNQGRHHATRRLFTRQRSGAQEWTKRRAVRPPNCRNPLARDSRKPASWFFIPDRVGVQGGVVVISQPCTVSELDVESVTGHREGDWPEAGHVLGFEERQRVYVASIHGEL